MLEPVAGDRHPGYLAAKYEQRIGFSTALAVGIGVMVTCLWVWDWAVDSAHAPDTWRLRLLLGLAVLAYAGGHRAGLGWRAMYWLMLACAAAAEFLCGLIINRLDGGAVVGVGAYLFVVFLVPLVGLPYSFRKNAVAILVLLLLPVVTMQFGVPEGMSLPIYLAMNGPTAGMSIFIALVLDRLMLRNYLDQAEMQRLGALALAESQRRYRTIFEGAVEGIFRSDDGGHLLDANPAMAKLLGFPSLAAMQGALPAGWYPAWVDAAEVGRFSDELRRNGQAYGHECRLRANDGRVFWCQLNARRIAAGTDAPATIEGFAQDISERREFGEARERALAEAEKLARLHGEFLANMSHELRTPLNGVLGMAQVGIRRHGGDPEALRTYQLIMASGQELLSLVEDILDFSCLDQGRAAIESRPLPLRRLLRETVEAFAGRTADKGLDLQLQEADDLPETCIGDPMRLRQILNHLLSNALKFTATGGIGVTAACDGGLLRIEVRDSGIGMTDAQLEKAFAPFEQADGSMTRRYGGAGLGLAITRHIVDQMGGSVAVASAPEAGTTVTVRLPLVPASGDTGAAPARPAP